MALSLAGATMAPLRDAWFWQIDDHAIIDFTVVFQQSASFGDAFLQNIQNTELGHFADDGDLRCRPVYYVLQILQSAVFGSHPSLYFLINALMLAGGLFALGMAASRFFSWPLVLALLLATLSLGFHRDLWCRLGPVERDAFCFLMLFICAAAHEKKPWAWPLACISAALAIGEKENFLILLLPLAYLGAGVRKKLSLLWALVPVAMAVPVGYVMFRALFIVERDQYSSSLGLSALVASVFRVQAAAPLLLGLLFVGATALTRKFHHKGAPVPQEAYTRSLAWEGIAFCGILFNILFYREHLAWHMRYGFPAYFLVLVIFCILLYNFMFCMSKRGYNVFSWIILAVACLACFPRLQGLYVNNQWQASRTQNLEDVFTKSKKYRDVVFINPRQSINGWEPFIALRRFAGAGLVASPFYYPLFQTPTQPLYAHLDKTMKRAWRDRFSKNITSREHALLGRDFNGNFFIFDPLAGEHEAGKVLLDQSLQRTADGSFTLDTPTGIYAPREYEGLRLVAVVLRGKFPEGVTATCGENGGEPAEVSGDGETLTIRVPESGMSVDPEEPLLRIGILPPKGAPFLPEIATVEFNYDRRDPAS